MSLLQLILGKPLATSDERGECVGPISGISIFGLDALSSAAYGPEAALTLLIPLGIAGVAHIVPISAAIIVLLFIVFFSYRQTIDAYPHGGGSYTVASENLGDIPGLFAAAALMIDYILNAAVGIAAGVGAVVSAFPHLQPHILSLCLVTLALLTLINMRGTKDAGLAFSIPTYLFIGSMLATLGIGAYRVFAAHGGSPTPIVAPPHLPTVTSALTLWLLLKVFASGCTAMTGVEAVSNGVNAFRPPTQTNAKHTLTIIIVLLAIFLGGLALLCRAYNIGATDPTGPGYQSVLSQLIAAIMGRGIFYYVSIASILAVLAFSANTSFADFPRLTRAIAERDYLPHVFIVRGRRLLYSHGIYALVGFTALLLIAFGGVTDRLIPLFAIGAFLAFTLSQAGMVVHWYKQPGTHWHRMLVNGIGAIATGITLLVVLVAKFLDGAWITAILIPGLIFLMLAIKRHYDGVTRDIAVDRPIDISRLTSPLVVLPINKWDRITEKSLRFALKISDSVEAIHVDAEECRDQLCELWDRDVAKPLTALNHPTPKLTFLESPFRFILLPLVDHVLELEAQHPERQIAVLIPELVVKHWWQTPLHNQRAQVLKLLLLLRGNQRILVINIPWYL